jgi:hypothetical protein
VCFFCMGWESEGFEFRQLNLMIFGQISRPAFQIKKSINQSNSVDELNSQISTASNNLQGSEGRALSGDAIGRSPRYS